MIRDEAHWLELTDAFYAAALGKTDWYQALEGLATATGSRGGELVGFGSNDAVPFNIMTGVDPSFAGDFIAHGGGDPERNPRVKAGWAAPVLQVLAEEDFLTPSEHKTHPHYCDFSRRWDLPFCCLTTLERQDDLLIGLAVLRSEKQGHISAEQKANFTALAPHVRAAVRTQIILEGQGALILKDAMDALRLAAFICDRRGNVMAMSAEGEAVLRSRRGLRLKAGVLGAVDPSEHLVFEDNLRFAAQEWAFTVVPRLKQMVLRSRDPLQSPLILDIVALPSREFEFRFSPRILVVARHRRTAGDQKMELLQMVYGLTRAEADIALRLAQGHTAEVTAHARNVSVGTVRAQIKTVLGKVGVKRQIELVARLNEL